MQLTVGQTVVHPHHGPATVLGFMTRTLKGKVVDYVNLEVPAGDLAVSVPVSSLAEVGIRRIACREMLAGLAQVLCTESVPEPQQWARRVKSQRIELASGDPLRIAAVVRDLIRRREDRGLSLAERAMLTESADPLVAELAVAVHTTEDEALEVLESLVMERNQDALERHGLLAAA
ncbi:MAG TPA: hypothetical protein GXZ45_02630 [Propionibacterium sp.]|nr:hypothetical protein [Propionibacterium sp.]